MENFIKIIYSFVQDGLTDKKGKPNSFAHLATKLVMPDPDAPGWEFPYVIDVIQWLGYAIFNFPSHVRWDRLGVSI